MRIYFTSFLFMFIGVFVVQGQNLSKFTMTTNRAIGEPLSFTINYGAAITVDWGDGVLSNYTSVGDSITGSVKGNTITVNGFDISVLDCSNQGITALNISELTDLRTITCQNNLLSALDVSKNIKLQKLNCAYNNLATITLTTNVALAELILNNNGISTLTLTANRLISTLICNDNKIKILTLTTLTGLKTLWCQNNQLNALDASKSTLLETLICYNNLISTLNVTGLTALTQLWCDVNKIVDLNTSTNTALKYLSANNGLISKLAIASPIGIQALYVNDNALGYSLLPSTTSITNYAYAPQNLITIPATSTNTVNLSAQLFTLNNVATNATFKWYNGANQLVIPDDYVESAGVFTFKKPFDAAYCQISTSVFAQLPSITTTTTAISVNAGFESAEVAKTLSVNVRNGKLILKSTAAQSIHIFTLLGVKIKSFDNFIGETEFTLPKGAYLVNRTKIVL